jgi:hypothetical protein
MKELNQNTLRAALERLPEYEPSDALWAALEGGLDADEEIGAQAHALPQYEPPDHVWARLEEGLAEMPARPALRPSFVRRYALAAAAAVALLLGAWWWLGGPTAEQIAVTQQTLDQTAVAAIAEPEDPAFALVEGLCRERMPICQNPDFKYLKTELDELTNAKQALRQALGTYSDDPELTAQLVRIEQERSALLRQMVAMI